MPVSGNWLEGLKSDSLMEVGLASRDAHACRSTAKGESHALQQLAPRSRQPPPRGLTAPSPQHDGAAPQQQGGA